MHLRVPQARLGSWPFVQRPCRTGPPAAPQPCPCLPRHPAMSTGHGPGPPCLSDPVGLPALLTHPRKGGLVRGRPVAVEQACRRQDRGPRAHRGHDRRGRRPGAQPGQEGLVGDESSRALTSGDEHDAGGCSRVVADGRGHLTALAARDRPCSGTGELDGEPAGNQAEQLRRPEHVQQLEPPDSTTEMRRRSPVMAFHPLRCFSAAVQGRCAFGSWAPSTPAMPRRSGRLWR